jgi:hypothetical protein
VLLERAFITLPTGAEVLTQAFSPARFLRGGRRQRSVLFKARGRHYLAKKRQWPDAGISLGTGGEGNKGPF